MKFLGQTVFIVMFVIFFTVAVLAGTAKFGLLSYSFWQGTFQTQNVYAALADAIKSAVHEQVDKQGGATSDIAVLTDLITPENTKDFVDHNLVNFIGFLNGKALELVVYVPINKAPQGLLPKNIAELNNEMTVNQLSKRFNIQVLEELPLTELSRTGTFAYYSFIVSIIALLILIILMVALTNPGSRFVAVGIALFFSGGAILLMSQLGVLVSANLTAGEGISTRIAAIVIPPLLNEILTIWTYLGIGLVGTSMLLFVARKPKEK